MTRWRMFEMAWHGVQTFRCSIVAPVNGALVLRMARLLDCCSVARAAESGIMPHLKNCRAERAGCGTAAKRAQPSYHLYGLKALAAGMGTSLMVFLKVFEVRAA